MAEVMLTPKVAEMLGTIDLEGLKSKRELEEEKWLEENRNRLVKEYGVDENFSEFEVLKVREYEENTAVCSSVNSFV